MRCSSLPPTGRFSLSGNINLEVCSYVPGIRNIPHYENPRGYAQGGSSSRAVCAPSCMINGEQSCHRCAHLGITTLSRRDTLGRSRDGNCQRCAHSLTSGKRRTSTLCTSLTYPGKRTITVVHILHIPREERVNNVVHILTYPGRRVLTTVHPSPTYPWRRVLTTVLTSSHTQGGGEY